MGEQARGVNGCEFTKIVFDSARLEALLPSIMKSLLSLLMCFVLLQAETFALRGGPGGRSGVEKVEGAYSGTMIDASGLGTSTGLFLLTAIQNGASTGQVVFFASSGTDVNTYSGTITGLGDPNSGAFTAVFGADKASNLAGSDTISGQMSITAKKAISNSATQTISGIATARNVAVIVAGSNIQKFIGALVTYTVSGWRTSSSTSGNPFPVSF